ncbi:Uncharacterized protein AXF42_Ash018432 [Apostasia shenzhenica]|uniref:DUF7054 domain-containing protein n=1 Tax=Apostasia shenzhenica TaxID=1088818 RepID=A0A2I0BED4_9ASPA|nr:Uncharacterized protein AXF42_Ash018432 [Apostasia shenzhenica]
MALQRPRPHRKGILEGVQLMEGKKNVSKGDSCRILITVTVSGSAGPIRFVVREDELVARVVGTVLKIYAREGRLPVLGSDLNDFVLHSAYHGSDAPSMWDSIGSYGSRNFLLYKKQGLVSEKERVISKKGRGGLKSWLNKFLSFRISPN